MKEENKRNIFCIILMIFLFLFSSRSYGQSYRAFRSEMDELIQKSKWRIGPFRMYPTLQLRDIGYDSNVYRERKQDEPVSDYTATISPQLRISLLYRDWLIFSFLENPEYVYFFNVKNERSFNNLYSPSLKILLFNRFVLSGNYQYRRARTRASSEFDIRAEQESKSYNGSFFYETARRTSLGFSGSTRKIRYEDITLPGEEIDLARHLNREETAGNFEIYYKIFSESFFFINGGYTEYVFEYRESKWRDSYSYQFYSGVIFPLLGRVRGTLTLGYKRFTPKIEVKRGFSGLVGNTNLNMRIRRFGFRVQYIRDCEFSFFENNIFFLEDTYRAGISFYLSQFLRLDYDFTYGESSYPESIRIRRPDEQYEEITRHDIYRLHTVGFVIRIVRSTGIGLRGTHWQRRSTIPGVGNRNRWFLGAYVTYEF